MKSVVFHPLFVHFPIAFYFLEFLLLVFFVAKRDPSYLRFALFAFRLGYLFMITAMIAGYIDAGGIVPRVRFHFFSALSVFTVYTSRAFYWHFGKTDHPMYFPTQLASAAVGNLLVALTGYFGGRLVFS